MIASKIIQTLTHLLLTIVITLFIITGFGIVNYRIVEQLTLGVLPKPISFQIFNFTHLFYFKKKFQKQIQNNLKMDKKFSSISVV
jgi:ABC-type bacteriocin/lantibiotic exporter with double-glycine peptidase domain